MTMDGRSVRTETAQSVQASTAEGAEMMEDPAAMWDGRPHAQHIMSSFHV